MWAFITKHDLFKGIHALPEAEDRHHLKYQQDTWFNRFFESESPQTVLEIGGGASRTLPPLRARNIECWNADKLEGVADGPMAGDPGIRYMDSLGVRVVPVYIGDFSPLLPDAHFDIAYSISVLEHLNRTQLVACFRDTARLLRPGGRVYHATDLFLGSKPLKITTDQIAHIRHAASEAGLEPVGQDHVGDTPVFHTSYATPSDVYLARKWCFTPELQSLVEDNALTCLITGHRKPV